MFYISLLEQDIIKRERVEKMPKIDAGNHNNKEYKVKAIKDNAVYVTKSKSGYLQGFYYLVVWKGYSKEENTWDLLWAVQHLKKLISCFHKKRLKKSWAISPPIDSALPMARPTIKPTRPTTKQKQGELAKSANKQAKNWVFRCL